MARLSGAESVSNARISAGEGTMPQMSSDTRRKNSESVQSSDG